MGKGLNSKKKAKAAAKVGAFKIKNTGVKLCARTPEGKAQRWEKYKKHRKALGLKPQPYKTWSNVYDANMEKANKANKEVTAYQKVLGWGETEVTVKVKKGVYRRLDIADEDSDPPRGVEYKGGKYTSHSPEITSEVERDALLVKKGWQITWHFAGTASQPLLNSLDEAGIDVTFG